MRLVVASIAAAIATATMFVVADTPAPASAPTHASAGPVPQVPSAAPVIDDYFGTAVPDPWRHLEKTSDADVQAWMQAEAAQSRDFLDSLPGRQSLLERIAEVDAGAPARVFSIERLPGEKYLYLKRVAHENSLRLYRRESATGRERVIVDLEPWVEKNNGNTVSFSFFSSSPFGRRLAYGLSQSGAEATTLRVLDTRTRRELIAPIDRTDLDGGESCDNGIGWLPDESGFFFNRLAEDASNPSSPGRYKWSQVWLRRIGKADIDPVPVFGSESPSGVKLDASDMPLVFVAPDERHAIAILIHGTLRELTAYRAVLSDVLAGRAQWTKIYGPESRITGMSISGNQLYLVTHDNAPRYKLIRTFVDRPDIASAKTLYEPERGVLVATASAKDALYVKVREGMAGRLLRIVHGTDRIAEVPLPARGTFEFTCPDSRVPGVLIRTEDWNRGSQYYRYDVRRGKWINDRLQPKGKYDAPDDIEVVEAEATSHDGARVPLSIVHRKGIRRDGRNPTLLQGYAAYGATDEPSFEQASLSWLQKGGVNAVCHARGGGAYGRAWYDAGKGATKANTWKDGIACAEWLIANGYASPATLAIFGGSAGGIFAGRVVIERPDLFAAAIIQNGALDMVRSETSAIGSQNIPEFGSVATPEGFRTLFGMSAYRHVKDGVRYPAMLFIHGVNDTRVELWHSLKMVARLRAAQSAITDANPVLLRLDFDAGHGSGSSRQQHWHELADMWSFIFWRAGYPGFQPSAPPTRVTADPSATAAAVGR